MSYQIYYNGSPINVGQSLWTRPQDWLQMSGSIFGTGVTTGNMITSTGAFLGLISVNSGSGNFVSLLVQPSCFINWGDGITTGMFAPANTQINYNYNYNNLPLSSYSSGTNGQEGYQQALVTIIPSGNGLLNTINLQKKNPQSGLATSNFVTNWLDIAVGGTNISNLGIGGSIVYLRQLQRAYIFSLSGSLINFSSMFNNCSSLQSVPLFNTMNGTNFSSMFNDCSSLQSVPLFNTMNGTNFSTMFNTCYSLQSVPLFNTMNGTNFSSMFNNCSSLQSVPLFNTMNGTNFSTMFQNCYSLQSVPLFNTMNGTNFSSMFNDCYSLQSVPLFNTMNGTNFSSMFNNCSSLQSVPLFNTMNGTNFSTMFQNCYSLQSVPLLNVTGASTGIIGSGNFLNMFSNCYNLQIGALSGIQASINYNYPCCLDYSNLQYIFNNLGTVPINSAVLNVSGNFGNPSITSTDITNVTGNGWILLH